METFEGLPVLVTGHTGFKGAWLATWLHMLGARVTGFALPPEEGERTLFEDAEVASFTDSVFGDIRDLEAVRAVFERARPALVFHLAAQSLVRPSYRQPVETYATNVMGTVHVLEAIRHAEGVRAAVMVTSDKAYENQEWAWGYRETDPMGGADPYSSSKGCAELASAAYRRSFFSGEHGGPLIATARAGNVIGGGDWARDRLVPDIVRAIMAGEPTVLRNPDSLRPWQHVLEPLRGYVTLAEHLLDGEAEFASGWNFGPLDEGAISVGVLARRVIDAWGRGRLAIYRDPLAPHEASVLKLDVSKAAAYLAHRPVLGIEEAVDLTVGWYRGVLEEGRSALDLTREQIIDYMDRLD